jgi:hypothetical protein
MSKILKLVWNKHHPKKVKLLHQRCLLKNLKRQSP